MSLSLYDASIPVFERMLGNLSAILSQAETHAEARKIDPSVLVRWRLAPDMYPLSGQIQIATDMAKGCVSRLAGVESPSYADTEATFGELQDRIAKTRAYLATFTPEALDGSDDRPIVLKMRSGELSFTAKSYLLNFVQPNFYFHVTTAYAILRHCGLGIGKMDFIGRD